MMNENDKGSFGIVANALVELMDRAHEAERRARAAEENAEDWRRLYREKDMKLYETQKQLNAEIEEHQRTRQALQRALTPAQKGEG